MSFAAVEHAAKGLCITAGLVTFRVTSLICLGSVCKLTPGLFIAKWQLILSELISVGNRIWDVSNIVFYWISNYEYNRTEKTAYQSALCKGRRKATDTYFETRKTKFDSGCFRLFTTNRYRNYKTCWHITYGKWGLLIHSYLTLVLNGEDGSASLQGSFTTGEKSRGTQPTEGWVSPRGRLDALDII